MALNRPGNIAAFEPDQQRVIEDIYELMEAQISSFSSVPSSTRSGGSDYLTPADILSGGDTTVKDNKNGTVTISSTDTNTVTSVGTDSPSQRTGEIYLLAGAGMTINQIDNDFTFEATGTSYSAGPGLELVGSQFAHYTPSPVATSSVNPGTIVIQSMEFDAYGHVETVSTIDLSSEFMSPGDGNGLLANTAGYVTTDTDTITRVGVDAASQVSGDIYLLAGSGVGISQVGNDITFSVNLGAGDVDDSSILVDGVVTTAKIADNSVSTAKMKNTYLTTSYTVAAGDTITIENGIILTIAT